MAKVLVALALIPMLVGPALANPPCRTCTVRTRTIVKKVPVVKKVIEPVAVFVPSYVATIAPYAIAAPTYAPPPPPPPAPVAAPAPAYAPQPPVSYGYVQPAVQAYAQPYKAPMPYKAPTNCEDGHARLAGILERLEARMAKLENGNGHKNGNGNGAEEEPEQPLRRGGAPAQANGLSRAFGKCAVCHSDDATKGGGFVMFQGGKLAPLSERELRMVGAKSYSGQMPPKDNKLGVAPLTDDEVSEIMGWIASQK